MPSVEEPPPVRPSPGGAGKLKGLEGVDASKRMHDYLTNQQRRKEEYWLRKYGKVLSNPPPPPRIAAERSTGSLPPLGSATHTRPRQRSGHQPLFTAHHPINSFPQQPDRRHNASNVQYHPMAPVQLPPLTKSNPDSARSKQSAAGGLITAARTQELRAEDSATQQGVITVEQSTQALGMEASAVSMGADSGRTGRAPPAHLPPLAAEGSVGVLPGFRSGPVMHMAPHTNVVHAAHQQHQSAPTYMLVGPRVVTHNKAMRDLQLELTVLKAIKAREDVLDRLRVACEKLDASLGGAAPTVLAPADPMVRLFYRLIGQLRSRTLDAVETLAAWHRRSQTREHFVYYGTPYMTNIGPDLEFLDRQPFLRTRLKGNPAINDAFLCHITPDGLPIEEVTSMDLRRGTHRFTSDALRIRMARKVLAMYCGGPARAAHLLVHQHDEGELDPEAEEMYADITGHHHHPHHPGVISADPVETRTSSGSSLREEDEEQYQALVRQHNEGLAPFLEDSIAEPSFAIDQSAWEPMEIAAEAQDEMVANVVVADVAPREAHAMESELEELPMPEDVVQPESPQEQPQWSAVTEEGSSEHQPAIMPAEGAAMQQHAEEVEDQEGVQFQAMAALEEEVEAEFSLPSSPKRQGDPAPAPQAAARTDTSRVSDQGQAKSPSGLDAVSAAMSGAYDYDLDDGAFIDFAIDAMVASLEPPYCQQVGTQPFTISGWEIDRQLDGLVDSLAFNAYGFTGFDTDLGFVHQEPSTSAVPATSLVHLQLHMSQDGLRVSILPAAEAEAAAVQPSSSDVLPGAINFTSHSHLSESTAQPACASAWGPAAQCSRPPTPEIRLHIGQVDGRLTCSLLPANSTSTTTATAAVPAASRTASFSKPPLPSRPASVLSQAAFKHTPSIRRVSGTGELSRPGTSQVRLCLNVSGDIVHANITPAKPSAPAATTHVTTVTPPQSRPGTSQVRLFLHLTDDHVSAQLVPRRSPSPLVGSQQPQQQAQQQPLPVASRPGTAQVQLVLSVEDDVVRAHLQPGRRTSQVGVTLDIPQDLLQRQSRAVSRSSSSVGQPNHVPLNLSGMDLGVSGVNAAGPAVGSRSLHSSGSMSRQEDVRLQLVLEFQGDDGQIKASLVPQHAQRRLSSQGSSNAMQRLGVSSSPLPTLEEETGLGELMLARPADQPEHPASNGMQPAEEVGPLHADGQGQVVEPDVAIQEETQGMQRDGVHMGDSVQQEAAGGDDTLTMWVSLRLDCDESGLIHATLQPEGVDSGHPCAPQSAEQMQVADDALQQQGSDGSWAVETSRPPTRMAVQLQFEGEELRVQLVPWRASADISHMTESDP